MRTRAGPPARGWNRETDHAGRPEIRAALAAERDRPGFPDDDEQWQSSNQQ